MLNVNAVDITSWPTRWFLWPLT